MTDEIYTGRSHWKWGLPIIKFINLIYYSFWEKLVRVCKTPGTLPYAFKASGW